MFKWIQLSCLGLIIASPYAYSQTELKQAAPAGQYKQAGIEQNLQQLLKEHGLLLNKAILAALNNEPQNVVEAGKTSLLANSRAIAELLRSAKGAQSGSDFEELFNQHILIGAQYINAIKAKNQGLANQVSNQAKANGRMLAQFFSRLSPSVPEATWQQMFDHHVMIEAEQTKAYFQGDVDKATRLKEESLSQLAEMATLIASALTGQASSQKNVQTKR